MSPEPSPALAVQAEAPELFIVLAQFEVGGTERHVLALTGSLVARGWRVTVYCLAGDGPLRGEFEKTGAVILLPPVNAGRKRRSLIGRFVRLARVGANLFSALVRNPNAVVHIFLPAAYVLAGPLALLARSRIRIMSRRSLNVYRDRRPFVWRFEQFLHPHMTAILGNSLSVVRELRHDEHVPADRLGLIYNGVRVLPAPQSRATSREKLGLEPSALVFVIVANLIPYKGHRDLFQALAIAKSRLPANWRLLVVGEDYGAGEELKALAHELKIDSETAFLGLRSDISEILAAGDIGLLCSHQEGFSNAIVEGMAAGLPMIVTDVGGNPEAVLHEQTGIVVPPHDPDRFADALVRLAGDAGLREKFGEAGRARAAEKFSLEQIVASYDALYRVLLAGGRPGDVAQVRLPAAALSAPAE